MKNPPPTRDAASRQNSDHLLLAGCGNWWWKDFVFYGINVINNKICQRDRPYMAVVLLHLFKNHDVTIQHHTLEPVPSRSKRWTSNNDESQVVQTASLMQLPSVTSKVFICSSPAARIPCSLDNTAAKASKSASFRDRHLSESPAMMIVDKYRCRLIVRWDAERRFGTCTDLYRCSTVVAYSCKKIHVCV